MRLIVVLCRVLMAIFVLLWGQGDLVGQTVEQHPEPAPGETAEAYADRVFDLYGPKRQAEDEDRTAAVKHAWSWLDPSWQVGQFQFMESAGIDIEGNVIFTGRTVEFSPDIETARVLKVDAAPDNALIQVYDQDLPFLDRMTLASRGAGFDQDGFLYALADDHVLSAGPAAVVRIAPAGFVQWLSRLEPFGSNYGAQILVDDEGVPYAVVNRTIYQLDPESGGVLWSTELPSMGVGGPVLAGIETVVMGEGVIFALLHRIDTFEDPANQRTSVLFRLDARTGEIQWQQSIEEASGAIGGGFRLLLDDLGRPLLAGIDTTYTAALWRFDTDGNLLQTVTLPRTPQALSSQVSDIVRSDESGDTFVVVDEIREDSRGGVEHEWTIVQLDADLAEVSRRSFGQEQPEELQTDRLGNLYAAFTSEFDTVFLRVAKFDPTNDLAVVWSAPREGNVFRLTSMDVDRGGQIFIAGFASGNGSQLRMDKYDQAYLAVPQTARDCVSVRIEDRSIWADGVGRLEESDTFFDESWNENLSAKACVHIPIPFTDGIDFGGGVGVRTSGAIEMGYKAEVDGGTLDVHLPMDIEWSIIDTTGKPPADGTTVRVTPTWNADPAARMTSCFQPTFNAGLTAGVEFNLYVDISMKFIVPLFDAVLLDTGFNWPEDYIPFSETLDYIPYLNLLDILVYLGFPDTGEWHTESDAQGFFEIGMGIPKLVAESGFTPTLAPDGLSATGGMFSTTASDRFLNLTAYISEIIHAIADDLSPYPLPPISGTIGTDGSLSFLLSYRVLQLQALCNFLAEQNIDVDVQPRVRYVLSTGQEFDLELEDPFEFVMSESHISITPYVYARMSFCNDTDVLIVPGVAWETAAFDVAASFQGNNLFSFGNCFLCYSTDFGSAGLDIYNNDWVYDSPQIELAPIRIESSGSSAPRLSSASRTRLTMLIYEQRSPSVNEFNLDVNQTTPMLLFGTRMAPGSQVWISMHGREEVLPTTVVNNGTILVRVPNRFRLLPGVARIWIQSGAQRSETLDIPVEFPRPVLDTVNPNLWAADPDLNVIPVQVIDAQTLRGADSFIARRDYFQKLRDDLWNATTAPGQTNGESAAAYFPCFDFNQLPPFPGVFMRREGEPWMPLPRFVQPVDSGIHNLRLAPYNYDTPGEIEVQLCNPGPGGGESRIRKLFIGAPIPQVTAIEPPFIDPGVPLTPGRTTVTISVRGPAHVSTGAGEEPKYSNFNRASIVRFDGIDLPTTYVSSDTLLAEVPFAAVQHPGVATITVFTPSNDSFYFEDIIIGGKRPAGMCYDESLTPYPVDDESECSGTFYPLPGLIPSGGESLPLGLPIHYEEPLLLSLSPAVTTQNAEIFSGDPSGAVITPYDPKEPGPEVGFTYANFSVMGDGFRPGAVVLIDGVERETTFCSRSLLTARLVPEDVAIVGERMISVRNPLPQADETEVLPLLVVEPVMSRGDMHGTRSYTDGRSR